MNYSIKDEEDSVPKIKKLNNFILYGEIVYKLDHKSDTIDNCCNFFRNIGGLSYKIEFLENQRISTHGMYSKEALNNDKSICLNCYNRLKDFKLLRINSTACDSFEVNIFEITLNVLFFNESSKRLLYGIESIRKSRFLLCKIDGKIRFSKLKPIQKFFIITSKIFLYDDFNIKEHSYITIESGEIGVEEIKGIDKILQDKREGVPKFQFIKNIMILIVGMIIAVSILFVIFKFNNDNRRK